MIPTPRLDKIILAAALALGVFAAAPARAIDLIAIGKLPGTLSDYSGQSALLENGVPGDLLGGMGSALAWAGGNTFLALPDRGPNATAWNAGVDHTTSYVPRFHTLQLDLTPLPDAGTGLPFTLTPTLVGTTLLYSHVPLNYGGSVAGYRAEPANNTRSRHYFSGRSDNFDAATSSADTRDARFDPEGIRVSRNGRFVYITDEYGPYLYEFDRASGARLRAIKLPAKLAAAHKSSLGADEISGNSTGRVANKGMEGLAISPDGKTLFGFVQSPLIEDGGDGGRANRIVAIDLETEEVREYAYDNYLSDKAKAYNSSELLALNDHELLVLERDGKGLGDDSKAAVKRVYKIDLAGAQEVSGLSGEAALKDLVPRHRGQAHRRRPDDRTDSRQAGSDGLRRGHRGRRRGQAHAVPGQRQRLPRDHAGRQAESESMVRLRVHAGRSRRLGVRQSGLDGTALS